MARKFSVRVWRFGLDLEFYSCFFVVVVVAVCVLVCQNIEPKLSPPMPNGIDTTHTDTLGFSKDFSALLLIHSRTRTRT